MSTNYVILYDWMNERYQGVTREVYALLYGLITNGMTKISNTYIATRLHVGEYAVKKALRILQADGIIVRRSGKHRGELTSYEKGLYFAPLMPEKGVQNTPLMPEKGVQNTPLMPEKGVQNTPLNINNNIKFGNVKENQTKPNRFSSFEEFDAYVGSACNDVDIDIRTKFAAYHSKRTFWRNMSQEDVRANLQKWVETEYPHKCAKSSISCTKTFEEYYSVFGTTECVGTWQKSKDENGNTIYIQP